MAEIATREQAGAALEKARDLMERIVDGDFYEEKALAASNEASELFNAALAFFAAASNTRAMAEIRHDLGTLAMNDGGDRANAKPHLLAAAELFEALGDKRARLAALLDLSEVDPREPVIGSAVAEAVGAGLPGDLGPREDPLRLFLKLRDEKSFDDGLPLLQSLVEEAGGRDDKPRLARLLRERSKTQGMWLKDRDGAISSAEEALRLSEAADDKEGILAALLQLVDLHWSRGAQKMARELFERAEKVRGVPEYLRKLRKIMAMNFS